MSKKIPKTVLREAWAKGTNTGRKKARELNRYPYNRGVKIIYVKPKECKEEFLAATLAALEVVLKWMRKHQSK